MSRAGAVELRGLRYGDVPLASWAGGAATGTEPWKSFTAAQACLADHDEVCGRAALLGIVAQPGLESRHSLQAWDALRALGDQPSASDATTLPGVVVNVAIGGRTVRVDNGSRSGGRCSGIVSTDRARA